MWKQLKSFKHPKGVFSVGMRRKKTTDECSYRVTISPSTLKHTEAFANRDNADVLFARLVRDGAYFSITWERSTENRLEDAAYVRANPKARGVI